MESSEQRESQAQDAADEMDRRAGEMEDRADELGARRPQRLVQPVRVHIRPPALAPVGALERNHREYPVGPDPLPVPEVHQPRIAPWHRPKLGECDGRGPPASRRLASWPWPSPAAAAAAVARPPGRRPRPLTYG